MKKDLGAVSAKLSSIAEELPSEKPARQIRKEAAAGEKKERKPKVEKPIEPITQFPLKMRRSLHNELKKLAVNNDMTMRGFILDALKAKGLQVTEADLIDGRKR